MHKYEYKRNRKKQRNNVQINYTIHNCKKTQKRLRQSFQGACIDTGAQRSVIGYRQLQSYCRENKKHIKIRPSKTVFKFGDGSYQSSGKMKIKIPTPKGKYMFVDFDIVNADVPMLIGLDVLDNEKMYANNVTNELVNVKNDWVMNLTRKFGHLFLQWYNPSKRLGTYFTKAELTKLHRHFHHPSSSKLLALIKRSKLCDADSKTRELLQEISNNCNTCKQFSTVPQ